MEKMTEKKDRQLSVDFVKIIAMVGVMILHSQVSIFDGNPIALAMSDAAVYYIPAFTMFVCISTIGMAWFVMKIPYMNKVFKI